jgi:hypothetical protein
MLKSSLSKYTYQLKLGVIILFSLIAYIAVASNFAISHEQEAVFFDKHTQIRLLEVSEMYAQGEPIKVVGNVYNITTDSPIPNYKVVIRVLVGDDVIFMGSEESDSNGNFEYTSPPVITQGNPLSIAIGNGLHDETVVTIPPKPSEDQAIQNNGSLAGIIATIAIAFTLFYFSQRVSQYTIFLFGGFGAIFTGYILLFSNPPFTNDVANTAFAAALLAPIATIGIDYIKNKQEFEKQRAESAVGYRDEKLKSEVELLAKFLNEVADHFVILSDEELEPLPCSMRKSSTVGTLANLPTAWLKQYYQCISDYNDILLDRTQEDKIRNQETIKKLKDRILGMQKMIYFNLSYNIIMLQKRFLSFPSVETPTRYNTALLNLIWESGIIKNDINPLRFPMKRYYMLEMMWRDRGISEDKKFEFYKELRKTLDKEVNIYTEQNAYELMHFISNKFKENYEQAAKLLKAYPLHDPIRTIFQSLGYLVPYNTLPRVSF